jgi:FKBP-type peptidyl-prolyl cis-trans isomerase
MLPGCSGETRRSTVESIRTALNPPIPQDTIPEALDYDADLGVDIAEMAKLPLGVLYAEVLPGEGTEIQEGDSVSVLLMGWLPDATLVDSVELAIRVGAGDVVAGIDAALPGMRPGGKRRLVLTPGLAWGVDGKDNIPPNAVLVYDVDLRTRITP